jgi:hypothetical protein
MLTAILFTLLTAALATHGFRGARLLLRQIKGLDALIFCTDEARAELAPSADYPPDGLALRRRHAHLVARRRLQLAGAALALASLVAAAALVTTGVLGAAWVWSAAVLAAALVSAHHWPYRNVPGGGLGDAALAEGAFRQLQGAC